MKRNTITLAPELRAKRRERRSNTVRECCARVEDALDTGNWPQALRAAGDMVKILANLVEMDGGTP